MNARPQQRPNAGSRRRLGMFLMPVAIAAFAGMNSSAANAVLVKVAVEGLPSGLTVGVAGGFMHCPPSGAPFLTPSGSVQLTEEFITIFERVTLPGGRVVILSRLIPTGHYSGEITVIPPTTNGCNGVIPLDTFGYFYSVAGENTNGDPRLRPTRQLFPQGTSGQSTVQINDVWKAETVSMTENGATPTSVSKGQFHALSVSYADIFPPTEIVAPSLELTQHLTLNPTPGGGTPPNSGPGFPGIPHIPGLPGFHGISINLSIFKITLTSDAQVCLRVAQTTNCKSRSAGGNLVNGNVTVNVGQLSSTVGNNERVVNWVFRLDPAFGIGEFLLTAAADDADLATYTVDGVQQPLNLLNWKALQLPVSVTN